MRSKDSRRVVLGLCSRDWRSAVCSATLPLSKRAKPPPAASGVFSNGGNTFTYTTPSGGTATIQVVGLGNLAGTTVDQNGDLNLVFGGTNAFSKIVGQRQGG